VVWGIGNVVQGCPLGFYYIITKRGLRRASADMGFMSVAYNLLRLMNIIDKRTARKVPGGVYSFIFKNNNRA